LEAGQHSPGHVLPKWAKCKACGHLFQHVGEASISAHVGEVMVFSS
jgi:hypothetical protein